MYMFEKQLKKLQSLQEILNRESDKQPADNISSHRALTKTINKLQKEVLQLAGSRDKGSEEEVHEKLLNM